MDIGFAPNHTHLYELDITPFAVKRTFARIGAGIATIDGDDKFQAGKAYTITLTFSQKNIELSATLAEWSAGTGSGLVE